MKSRRFQFSIFTVLLATAIAAVAVIAWQKLHPALFVQRLDNGNLVLQEDPRERLSRDDSYSMELIQELYPFSEEESKQWSDLQSGIELFRAGNLSGAISAWQLTATTTKDSELEIAALWNIGQTHHHSGDLSNAINHYKRALAVAVESNSKHYIAIDLSHAYVQLGQLPNAIETAQLSKTRYPPDSFCGLSYDADQQRISNFISTLHLANSQNRTVHLQTKSEWKAARTASLKE
ncbi:MAG: tetratricopeptide repeat protein [Rubripirellula sp.]